MRILLLVISLLFLGCQKDEKTTLAANEWIGYAPIFYANEKGWLKKINIRLIRTVSLAESVKLYKSGFVCGLAATQYEYEQLSNSLKPVVLLDKSYGGDMILSNKSLKEVLHSKIYAYLEIDSVNSLLLSSFLEEHSIPLSRVEFIDNDQAQLAKMKFDLNKTNLIVTYAPYDVLYKKMGFKVLASTKSDSSLLVVDAVFVDKHSHLDSRFKKYIKKAIQKIKADPKQVFDVVKNYYPQYDNYDEFKKALSKIEWLDNPSENLVKKLKKLKLCE